MKRQFFWGTFVALIAMAALVIQTDAQIKKGKERPLQTKHLMSGLIGPQCTALGKSFEGDGPADDKAWDKAISNAELLNESAHIMMADGRCPDAVWADSTKVLRECSAVVLKSLEKKDLAGAKSAFGEMTKSCASCHKAHKK